MLAVIKGDIIASRKLVNQEKWLSPLKDLFGQWGKSPKQWEIVWGDFFQLQVDKPEEALWKAFQIKTLVKKIEPKEANRKTSTLDVRMAIGIGEKEYSGKRISESNGPAFIFAAEQFEKLKKERTNLAIQSLHPEFDGEINLYLKLAGVFMDKWTVSSAKTVALALQYPKATQEELGNLLHIKQSAVSGRWNRANVGNVLEIERVFREKLKNLRP